MVIAWIAEETRHAGQEASESQPLVSAQGEGSCRLLLHKNDVGIAELYRLGSAVTPSACSIWKW